MKSIPQLLRYSVVILPSILAAVESEPVADKDVYILEDFVVTSPHPPEKSVLPNDHPFSSVYGYETGILDTPRNVTVISKTQMEAISLKDPRDFTKLTSSSYTGSNFGAPTTPSLRGQTADMLLNGMRKGMSNNGNGLPLNMNSVESANILKGPPSVMIGVSQYVGGYVDLITKRPTGTNEGSLSMTADSEGLLKGTLDQNFAVSEELNLRFSLTGEDTDDYYWDDSMRKSVAFYGALDWKPNERYQLELMGEYFSTEYTENWGINRPTDDLIDHRTYVTGIGSTAGFNDSLTPTGTTKIDREARLHGEGDDSEGDYISLQAIQTIRPDSDLQLVNNSLFQYRDRETYSSYQYSEVLRDNFRFENRTELRTEQECFGMFHKLNFGIATSYQDIWAVNDYYHEPANAWDLANQPYSDIGVTDADVFSTAFYYNAFPIRGESARGKLSARPGSNSSSYLIDSTGEFVQGNQDSNDSQTTTIGAFFQDNTEINSRLNLLFGARLDYVYVESEDPMYDDMIRYLQANNPAGDYSDIEKARDTHGDFVPNFNIGLVYKLAPSQRLYTNYNYSESIPVDLGGGVALQQTDDPNDGINGTLDKDAFDSDSHLVELGYKGTFFEDTLYLMANVFYQERLEPQSIGEDQEVEAKGFETEIHYQPSEDLYFIVGYSYVDSITRNGRNSSRTPIDANAPTYRYGTFTNFEGYDADTPGVPEHIFNMLTSYRLTEEFSASLGLLVTGPMDLAFSVPADQNLSDPDGFGYDPGPLESSEIPWQFSVDLGFRYDTPRWALALYVLNATDEENWGTVQGLYGNDSIYAELPRRYELTASLKW